MPLAATYREEACSLSPDRSGGLLYYGENRANRGRAIAEAAEFLARLSSSDPVPGGGSVAALQVAMGAALLVMVSNLTIGRKRYLVVEGEVTAIRARAERLRDEAQRLIDEDISAYGSVAAAMALARDTDQQKARRRESIQSALKGAAAPPLATMRAAREVAELAEALVQIGNPSAVSDVGTAASAARAGYEAARFNVEINLAAVDDGAWCEATRRELASVSDPEELVRAVLEETDSRIRGGA